MADKIKPEIAESKPLTDEQKAELFVKEYNQLCEKHQLRIVTAPVFKARDDNTFSVVLQTSIGKIVKQ